LHQKRPREAETIILTVKWALPPAPALLVENTWGALNFNTSLSSEKRERSVERNVLLTL
jgi:hypothetical protein